MPAKQDLPLPVVLTGLRTPGSHMISEFVYAIGLEDLDVTFNSDGSAYRYYNVPVPVVMALYSAAIHGESVGAFFIKNIKNSYKFDKITGI